MSFRINRNQGFLEKWLIPDLVQEVNKIIFEHLVVSETKEASKAMTHIQKGKNKNMKMKY